MEGGIRPVGEQRGQRGEGLLPPGYILGQTVSQAVARPLGESILISGAPDSRGGVTVKQPL